ncbi:MAG: CoB--CoM heterodisulfide reductase iron-sulfur subunit B family protein [Chloroflexaceae bacterium]
MQLAYYPGCTIKVSAREHEQAALAILRELGVELHEMAEWNCCGVVHTLTSENLIRHMAPLRVLARLQQQGEREVVTLCDMCFNTLARANQLVRTQPEQMAALNATSGGDLSYDGAGEVLHLLQLLRDRVGLAAIRRRVRRPLRDLAVYPYYGCKLLRPTGIALDDPETPTLLRDLMEALGATVIEGSLQTRCCGAYLAVDRAGLVTERVSATVEQARSAGAGAIVLSCPLCHFNFATLQPHTVAPLPVLYYSQVIGLAFDLDPAELGLDDRQVEALGRAVASQALC